MLAILNFYYRLKVHILNNEHEFYLSTNEEENQAFGLVENENNPASLIASIKEQSLHSSNHNKRTETLTSNSENSLQRCSDNSLKNMKSGGLQIDDMPMQV